MTTYSKEYYLKNRERIIAKQLEYYYKTKTHDKIIKQRIYNHQYYLKNKHNWNTRSAYTKINDRPTMYVKEQEIAQKVEYKKPNFWVQF